MIPFLSDSSPANGRIRRRRSHEMKTVIAMLALAISTAVPALLGADDESAQARNAHYKQLQQQINDYYKVDSSWRVGCREKARASTCDYIELETTLLHLMEAEVGSWQLCDNLKQLKDEENYATATGIERILHEEFLSTASKAVPILKKHPNEPLVKLLITHLETHPNDWVEEGWEDLLPNLKKLLHAKSK
jgi:uncharacterized protein YbdZ (MbtH family)